MINIDTRLLDKVDENEAWLLLQLARRINGKEKLCWPSNKTLCKDTDWNIDKVQRVKKALMEKGLLEIIQRPETSNIYKITTPYLSIYIKAEDFEFEELPPTVKDGTPPLLFSGTPSPVKSGSKVLTNEVLTNEQLVDLVECFNTNRMKYGYLGKSKLTPLRSKAIRARAKESNTTVSEIKKMIEFKAQDLKGKNFSGTPAEKYFDLDTLFRPSLFQKYIEQSQAQPAKDWTETRTQDSEDFNAPLGNISW